MSLDDIQRPNLSGIPSDFYPGGSRWTLRTIRGTAALGFTAGSLETFGPSSKGEL